jgi:Uma2 family endonuclease
MTGLTWQDFLDLPGEIRHASLIDGDLYVNAPAPAHQYVVSELLFALMAWTKAGEGRGEATIEPAVQINHNTGYMPDIAWWWEDKCAPRDEPSSYHGPPDLVVEVLSPSTRRMDTIRKRNDYPTIGVGELWLVDPEEPSVLVVRFDVEPGTVIKLAAADTLTSPQLPGFAITVRDLVDRRSRLRSR